jgi:HSP20 family molecular chaperone IbpA
MSAPATALTQNTQRNVQLITDGHHDAFAARLQDSIAKRAYAIFENAGRPAGQDQAHWFRAESEVLQHGSPIRESGSWSTANASLPGVDAADVQVLLLGDRAILSCSKPSHSYLSFRFPVSVDPQTAAAYLKGQTFVLTAKHSPSSATPSTRDQARSVTATGALANNPSAAPAPPARADAPLNQKSGSKP